MKLLPLLALALPLAAFAAPPAPQDGPLPSLPYTPALDAAAMDRAADPCVDFYQFSCGGWIKNNPIPADQASWDVYGKLHQENMRYLWGLLDRAARPDAARGAAERRVGDYFAACMDEAAVDKRGAEPLKPVLARIAALRTKDDVLRFVAAEQLAGGAPLFGFGSTQDLADAEKVIAGIDRGGMGLPERDYYLSKEARFADIRAKYRAHVEKMFKLLGDAPEEATREAEAALRVETALAEASYSAVDRRNPHNMDHKMAKAELAKLAPSIPWNAYFAAAGAPAFAQVNVAEPKFVEKVSALLKAGPDADLKSYLRWQALHARADELARPFAEESFDFYGRTMRGRREMPPRWKFCANSVDRDLGEELGKLYVEKTFPPAAKQEAARMTALIKEAMAAEIKALDWMSPETKKRALEKLASIRDKVGYPEHWRDYSSIKVDRADFVGNVERAQRFEMRRQLGKIGRPLDRGEWGMTPPTVNAYFNPQMNDINFPAGVLQPPLFDLKIDLAPSYGDTGGTIGHELTHGFDDEGRQFDAKGNLVDWWNEKDAKAFEERVACVKKQYAGYVVVDDIHINSDLSAGEDVADLGGTLLGYLAWKKATAGQTLEPREGLTPDQRFFVGMAQWACGADRAENLRLRAATDPHSPLKYRVNGVVANLPQFAQAFACKAGQPMVNPQPCKVW